MSASTSSIPRARSGGECPASCCSCLDHLFVAVRIGALALTALARQRDYRSVFPLLDQLDADDDTATRAGGEHLSCRLVRIRGANELEEARGCDLRRAVLHSPSAA